LIRLYAIEFRSEGGWRSGAGAKSTTRSCSDFGLFFAWVGRIRRILGFFSRGSDGSVWSRQVAGVNQIV